MSKDILLPVSEAESVIRLNKAGYRTVFDIVDKSRAHFIKTVPDMDATHAREIYRQARKHAETLKSLLRSWQLRQEPLIGGLKKLATSSSPLLKESLLRNLGGDGDFSDLLARSAEYADAASIQSLFSPGRYAVALYKVARNLHEDSSAFDINNRRPDLQELILSETTMNQEITTLDLLLEILQGNNSDNLNALSESFFPMTLPYDDKLVQINAALSAQGRTLNGIWDSLSDTQASFFTADAHSTRSVTSQEVVSGQRFFLKTAGGMVWLSHATAGGASLPGAHLNVGEPSASAAQTAPLHITQKDGLLYLGIDGDVTLNNISLSGCYLMADSGEDNGEEGIYARMGNAKGNQQVSPTRHLAITLESDGNNGTWLKTSKGYIGHKRSGASDWPDALTVTEDSTETALLFTFCKDEKGDTTISPEETQPPYTTPNPPARTILNLTPLSYQLMANEALNKDNIANHYGLQNGGQRSAIDLVAQLNDISIFRDKTGLTFNQVLELTAQADYAHTATDASNNSIFYKYSNHELEREKVWKYGAAYLNSGLDDIQEPDERLLWIQPEVRDTSGNITTPAALNFTNDTLVSLAGNAEKLIRLRNTTGLSFEMLDWVIVSASKAAGYDSPVPNSLVLSALAACVDLQERYGITSNTFVSFIGPVNPYARAQEKSFYEDLFTQADQTNCIPLGGNIKCNGDAGSYESACFKALGVTSDEFSRICRYCFGNAGTFKMSEITAGQIYRFGAIPRMLGLTFAEAECLWQLMAGGSDTLMVKLGRDTGFAAIDLIRRTEQVLSWMADNNLNLIQVQAMVSTVYSGTATAEMFTFLQNIYHSVKDTPSTLRSMNDVLQKKVYRALAGGFNLKANIMAQVTKWLDKTNSGFTLDGYWKKISDFFSNEQNTTVENLQQDASGLVEATQRLSQLVLVARWLNLSEQDLMLLTDTPEQLDSSLSATPQPTLPILLLLTRFKRWQNQVTTSTDEALRLLPLLADDKSAATDVADKIAALHNLTADSVNSMNNLLFGSDKFPASFAQLYTLLTWLRTSQMLNVGTTALHDLLTMAQSSVEAEDSDLLTRVANALTAGLSR